MSEFATYARFYSAQDAESLLMLLRMNNIPYKMEHERNQLDSLIIGDSMDAMFRVDVPSACFNEINELVESSYSDGGTAANDEENFLDEYMPERLSLPFIILGYVLSGFALIGIFAAITLLTSKRRLRNGDAVRMYDDYTRRHAKVMLAIGIIFTAWHLIRKTGWPFFPFI